MSLKKPSCNEAFQFCLNTSTIDGQKLTVVEKIEIAAKAGYQAVEPWIRELDQYMREGGLLADLKKRVQDAGLAIAGVIGFFEWVVEDENQRKKGMEEAKRCMDMVQQIGGNRLAAPPFGATERADLNLLTIARRYRELLALGEKWGVVPQVEFWGRSQTLGRLGEAALVAIHSNHPNACILADVYHLYKGDSGFHGLKLLAGGSLPVFHFNDYPAVPSRAEITDAHRVFPGDGIAPLGDILNDLRTIGFQGYLSLELFNRDYWADDPLEVARSGLEKMKAVEQEAPRR
jgi:2-keto-myo-inositol isomerase